MQMQNKNQLRHYTSCGLLKVRVSDFLFEDIIAHLIENPNIQALDINYEIIRRSDVSELQFCGSVHELHVMGRNVEQKDIIGIANNSNIIILSLIDCNIGDEGARSLAASNSIWDLDVTRCNISDIGAGFFLTNKSIKRLNLSGNPIQSTIVDQLINAGKNIISDDIPPVNSSLRRP